MAGPNPGNWIFNHRSRRYLIVRFSSPSHFKAGELWLGGTIRKAQKALNNGFIDAAIIWALATCVIFKVRERNNEVSVFSGPSWRLTENSYLFFFWSCLCFTFSCSNRHQLSGWAICVPILATVVDDFSFFLFVRHSRWTSLGFHVACTFAIFILSLLAPFFWTDVPCGDSWGCFELTASLRWSGRPCWG